jgi:Fuc2NAc and GlcNAc transferase
VNVHWLWPAAAVASFALTWAAMRLAERRQLLDVPNERSSHARPVPRGGGVAVVLTFMAGVLVACYYGMLDASLLALVLGGGTLLGLVGVADDYRDVPAGWRLVLHMLVAGWALYWLGGIPSELLPGVPSMLLNFVGLLCIVWFINLYNFMDGIDGIAGIETITVCLGSLVLHAFGISDDTVWIPPAILLASVAGFLFWNYPPARIFLGDAGSGFLGFMMAVFCIQAAQLEPAMFWAWIILLGVFVVDASVTLARRMLRRQRVEEAHRSHAYQFASRKYAAHAPVSLAVGAINLVWLLPLALLVASGRAPAIPALLIAYAPLIWLAFHFKAGAPEPAA